MLSFVHISALVGLLAVGIPIVIHMIKLHQRRQEIPSLLLFTALKKTSRRHKLQNILLLIARIFVVLFLILLLARPFIEWSRNFFQAGDNQRVAIGVVLDDSLTSMVSVRGQIMFEIARQRILQQLSQQSEDSVVLLATTSSGVASKAMSLEQAVTVIKNIEAIPVTGDLGRSVESVVSRLKQIDDYNYGGILVAAPPIKSLWDSVDFNAKYIPEKLVAVDFLSSQKLDPIINNVSKVDMPEQGIRVNIIGDPYNMTKGIMEVRNQQGEKIYSLRPDLKTAVTQTIFIPEEDIENSSCFSVHYNNIGTETNSPFSSFFYEPVEQSGEGRIFILYDNSKISTIYAQIVFITLEAVLDDFRKRIAFVNCDEQADALDNSLAPKVVFVTPLKKYNTINKWLVDILNKGRRIICFPALQDNLALPGVKNDIWPIWESAIKLPKPEPMILLNSPTLSKDYIKLYGKGLNHVRLNQILPVKTLDDDTRIFTCSNKSILVSRELDNNGELILWGVPLNKSAVSLLSNPLFPQLFKIMIGMNQDSQEAATLFQGTTIDIAEWLGKQQGNATCQLPNHEYIELNWGKGNPEMIYLDDCGFYFFELMQNRDKEEDDAEDAIITKTVNCPRVPVELIDIKQFQQKLNDKITISTEFMPMKFWPIPDKQKEKERDNRVVEDLTPIVAFALLLIIMMEMIVLIYGIRMGRMRADI